MLPRVASRGWRFRAGAIRELNLIELLRVLSENFVSNLHGASLVPEIPANTTKQCPAL